MKYIWIFLLLFTSCSSSDPACLPYAINKPHDVVSLPDRLKEISGICYYSSHELACIQDEKGSIYLYDLKKGKVREAIKFSKDRDYEAITNVADTLYIMCSNGELFKVWNLENEKTSSEIFKTPLNKENNCEGLCFDRPNNRLLIACKGNPIPGTAPKHSRAVYGFDLAAHSFSSTPLYIVYPDSVRNLLIAEKQSIQIIKETGEEIPFDFAPSEINMDPNTGNLLFLSSIGKTILSVNRNGQPECAIRLDPKLFRQPEGLTFKPNGDMLISDEGKDGKASLITIKLKKAKE